ncbi:hypothetical protein BDQ17DRAFT_1266162 [Cyathus striatus]|nr:hypothetical protein BDQ17DRAFT_1266162 [Cyathus striatus]
MTPRYNIFDCASFQHLHPPKKVKFGDNSFVDAVGMGSITLCDVSDRKNVKTMLHNVLYIPLFTLMLISIWGMDKAGYYSIFKNGKCTVKNIKGCKPILHGYIKH